jgi:hypothetical protein
MPGRAGGGLEFVLAGPGAEEVDVVNTDDGVDLVITAEAENVERLQARLEGLVTGLKHAAGRGFGPAAPPGIEGPPGVLGLILRGEAEIDVHKTDDGAVVSLTSGNPDVVHALQENAPDWVAQARERFQRARRGMQRRAHARRALELVASEQVQIETEETKGGVAVLVTSDDPDLVERLRREVPEGIDALKEFARRMDEWRERRGEWGERAPAAPRQRWQRPRRPEGHMPPPREPRE